MAQVAYKNESDLLSGLRTGDEQAFSIIFKKYWFHLYEIALAKLKSHELAEEIVQDLLVNLWEKRNRLLISNLTHYLNVSLRNRCIDHIRRNLAKDKYSEYLKSTIQYVDSHDKLEADELDKILTKGFEELPPKTRHIFELNRVEGLSNAEIAARTKMTEKSVEYHITKSLKRFRQLVKSFLGSAILILISYFS